MKFIVCEGGRGYWAVNKPGHQPFYKDVIPFVCLKLLRLDLIEHFLQKILIYSNGNVVYCNLD